MDQGKLDIEGICVEHVIQKIPYRLFVSVHNSTCMGGST